MDETQLIAQLKEYGDAIDNEVTSARGITKLTSETERHLGGLIESEPSKERTRVLSLAAVMLVAIGLGTLATTIASNRRSPVTTAESPTGNIQEPATAPATIGITQFDAGPLASRSGPLLAGLEDGRIVVWGGEIDGLNLGLPSLGQERFTDGAVFTPSTQIWKRMATTDLLDGDSVPVAVTTNSEIVVYAGTSGAAWNWTEDEWRALPESPSDVSDLVLIDDMVISVSASARLDLQSQEWIELSQPSNYEAPIGLAMTMESEGSLYLADGSGTVFGLNEDFTWTRLGKAPLCPCSWLSTSVYNGRVVMASPSGRVGAMDPATGLWTDMPVVPIERSKLSPKIVTIDDTLVAFAGTSVAVFQAGDNRWRALPMSTGFPSLNHIGLGWFFGIRAGIAQFSALSLDALLASDVAAIYGWRLPLTIGERVSFDMSATVSSPHATLEQGAVEACTILARTRTGADGLFIRGFETDGEIARLRDPNEPYALSIDCGSVDHSTAVANRFLGMQSHGGLENATWIANSLSSPNSEPRLDKSILREEGVMVRINGATEFLSPDEFVALPERGWQIGEADPVETLDQGEVAIIAGQSLPCLPAPTLDADSPTFDWIAIIFLHSATTEDPCGQHVARVGVDPSGKVTTLEILSTDS